MRNPPLTSTARLWRCGGNCRAPRSWNGWWMGMDKETLHFSRPGGWEVVMSFEGKGVKVPKGEVAISSGKLEGGEVPKDTTVWVTAT